MVWTEILSWEKWSGPFHCIFRNGLGKCLWDPHMDWDIRKWSGPSILMREMVWENVCEIHTWTRTSENGLDQDIVMREMVWENVCKIHTWTGRSENGLDQDFFMREMVWENICGIHTWTRTSENDL